jgi:hypothetical protein
VSFDSAYELPYEAEPYEEGDDPSMPPPWVTILLEGMQHMMAVAIADAVAASAKILAAASEAGPGKPKRAALYPNAVEWVEKWLSPTVVRRDSSDFRWCPCWWDHPEVLARIQGLWETWEQSRHSAPAMLEWFHIHLDYHLPRLTSPSGPMAHCKRDQHNGRGPTLPLSSVPEGTFTGRDSASRRGLS